MQAMITILLAIFLPFFAEAGPRIVVADQLQSSSGVNNYTIDYSVIGNLGSGTALQYIRGDGILATLNTSVVPELTNLYFTQARFDTAFAAKSTTDLAEGSNLYFTNARARLALSATGPLSYDNSTGVVSLPFPMLIPNGGTPVAPTIAFNESGADTGIYSTGDGNLSIANNAVNTASFDPGLITFNVPISAPSIAVPGLWRTDGNAGTGGTAVVGTTDAQPWSTVSGGTFVDSYANDGSVTSILNVTQPDSTNFAQKRNQTNLSLGASSTLTNFLNQQNSVSYASAFDYAGAISGVSGGVDIGTPNTVNFASAFEGNIFLHNGGTTNLVKGINMNAGVSGATVGYFAGMGSYMNMGAASTGTGRAFEAGYSIANSTTSGWDIIGGSLGLSGTTVNTNNAQGAGLQVTLSDTAHSDQVHVINAGSDLNNSSTVNGLNGVTSNVVTKDSSAVSGQIFGVSNAISVQNASTNNGITGEQLNIQLQGTSNSGGTTALNIGLSQQDASVTSNSTALNISHTFQGTSSTTNATGAFIGSNLQDSSTMGSYTALQVNPTLNGSAAVTNLNPFQLSANINGTAVVTNPITMAQIGLFSAPTIAGATGLKIDLTGANIADRLNNQTAIDANGHLNFSFDYTIPGAQGIMFPNNFAQHPVVANGAPVSTLGFMNFFNPNIDLHDDWTADFTGLHLGAVNGMFLFGMNIDAGKAMDAVSGVLSGVTNTGGSGTITGFSAFRAAGVLPNGGSAVTGTEVGFEAMPSMCISSGGNCWAIRDNTSGAENYLGKLAIGSASKKVTNSDTALEIGNSKAFLNGSGSTATKNALTAVAGMQFYDSTLNELQWFDGGAWVAASGAGAVTSVSVATANGLAGSSSGGSTPALTLTTTVTGVVKGDGTALSAAVANTDYLPATTGSAIQKADGAGGLTAASAGTDFQAPISTDAAVANQFVTGFTAPNTFTRAQPDFTDLSGNATNAQLPTYTNHGVLLGTGSAGINATAAGTSGQVLTSNGAGADPTYQTPTAGGITQLTGDVTAGPGSGSQAATIANLAVTNAKIANATIDLTTKVTGVLPTANGGRGTEKQEAPSGTINNSNVTFTLSSTPIAGSTVKLYKNGLILVNGTDFTVSSATITMAVAPNFAETLYADYTF